MSDTVGLVRCAQKQNGLFLPTEGGFQRDCSELTAEEIDREVKKILSEAYQESKDILEEHRDQLELVTQQLLERETLDADAFNALLGRPVRAERPPALPPVEAAPVIPSAGENGFPI
jgi:cell division protease FtsH